jgi:hypothetical protein
LPGFIIVVPALVCVVVGTYAKNIAAMLTVYKEHFISAFIKSAALAGNKYI